MVLDPSWHRKLQRQRQTARVVAQAAGNCLRTGVQISSRLLRRLPAAASALNHHGSKLPERVAALVQDMGGEDRIEEEENNEVWRTQRKGKRSKDQ